MSNSGKHVTTYSRKFPRQVSILVISIILKTFSRTTSCLLPESPFSPQKAVQVISRFSEANNENFKINLILRDALQSSWKFLIFQSRDAAPLSRRRSVAGSSNIVITCKMIVRLIIFFSGPQFNNIPKFLPVIFVVTQLVDPEYNSDMPKIVQQVAKFKYYSFVIQANMENIQFDGFYFWISLEKGT